MSSENYNITKLWGLNDLAKKEPNDDPMYTWFVDNLSWLEDNKLIMSIENPFGADTDLFLNIGKFKLFKCLETGFVYANPRLTTEGVNALFESSMNAYFKVVEDTYEERFKISYEPIANELREIFPSGCKLLEVGCGSGALLSVLRDVGGFEVKGVEISPAAIEYHEKRKLDVTLGSVENLSGQDKYDAIVIWSVADHFADPSEAFAACFRLLRNGGQIFIANVNTDGFDISTAGADSQIYAPPSRVNFYNVKSLTKQLKQTGFKIINHKTPGKLDTAIVREYWRSGGKNGRNSWLQKILSEPSDDKIADKLQTFIVDNGLSGFQTVLASKP